MWRGGQRDRLARPLLPRGPQVFIQGLSSSPLQLRRDPRKVNLEPKGKVVFQRLDQGLGANVERDGTWEDVANQPKDQVKEQSQGQGKL